MKVSLGFWNLIWQAPTERCLFDLSVCDFSIFFFQYLGFKELSKSYQLMWGVFCFVFKEIMLERFSLCL